MLAAALTEVVTGHGRMILLTGEAGIGKSAAAAELISTGRAAGFRVCWAACRSGPGTPAYWPWTQVLRSLGVLRPGAEIDTLGPGGSEDSRFQLFDRLARTLVEASAQGALLLIFDDLHWADESSLLALEFVAEQCRTAPILLVGTLRDDAAGPQLLTLCRSAEVHPLHALAIGAATELMSAVAGDPPPPDLAAAVHRRTAGNPFFIREVTRLISARGGWPAYDPAAPNLPDGVRATLRVQLDRLPATVRDLLGGCAVIGREFAVDLVAQSTGQPISQVHDLLGVAASAGVLLRLPAPVGHYRFVHDLFHEAVYAALDDAPVRHLAVGRALEQRSRSGMPVAPVELAAQFQGAGLLAPEEELAYAVAAGHEAIARLAFEDAARHFDHALSGLDRRPGAPAGERIALLLDAGRAHFLSGHSEQARWCYRAAAVMARAAQLAEPLAEAALGIDRLGVRAGSTPGESRDLLEEAVSAGSGGPVVVSARLCAALARELHHGQQTEVQPRARELAVQAVALARQSGDDAVLAECLLALQDALWTPGSAAVRLPIITELIERARGVGHRELVAEGTLLMASALLETGDPAGRLALERFCELSDQLGHARARWAALSRFATLYGIAGTVDRARDVAADALALGRRIGIPDAAGVAGTQAWMLHHFVDTKDLWSQMEDLYGSATDPFLQLIPRWMAGERAGVAAQAAAYTIEMLPHTHDLEPFAMLAEVMAELGTPNMQSLLYERLRPYAGTGVVVGGCASYHGPVDHHLGLLARGLGRRDAAQRHFAAAIEHATRLGAVQWANLSRREHAAGRDLASVRFRRENEGWLLSFADRTVRVADSKGLADLSVLVGAPGREFTARELAGVDEPPVGADSMLDPQAVTAYRARLADLDADLAEAQRNSDLQRVAGVTVEREFLVAELTAAAGLSGRTRRLGDQGERIRKTVTARIRYAIDRLRSVHPALADHLTTAVSTGSTCSYRPPPLTEAGVRR